MRIVRFGGVAMLFLMLLACGSDPGDVPRADATSSSTSTVPSVTPTTVPVAQPGPRTLIAATPGELVALDLATGDATVLANNSDLAATLGARWGRVEGVDLSPDGSTVAFAFNGGDDNRVGDDNRSASGLFEVPADGSAPARRVALDTGDAYVSNPRYSPDGKFLAVYSGDRLAVLDGERASTGDGVQMPYPPGQLTWSPAGDALLFVPHFERSVCCLIASLPFDPATGQITDAATGDQLDGIPYFDSTGELRTMPDGVYSFDVDATGHFVIASDTTSQGLVWWDTTTAGEPQPRPLPLGISLQEEPVAIAW